MNRLEKAAQLSLFDCLDLKPKQSLLLVSTARQSPLAQVFRKVAHKAKLEVFFLEIPETPNKSPLLPSLSRNLLGAVDRIVLLAPHIDPESVNWLRQQTRSRVVIWPLLEEDAIARATHTDFRRLRERSRKLADILTIGRNLKVQIENGYVLEMNIHQRHGVIEAVPLASEQFCTSMPSGRAYIQPVTNSVNGEIFLQGIAGQHGHSNPTVNLKIVEGKITYIKGGKGAVELRRRLRSALSIAETEAAKPGDSRYLVEIGFGMNENAKMWQSELEDEKVLGTAHLGFGRRSGPGKTPEVAARGIIMNPTIIIDGREIMQNGKLMFE